MGFLIVYITHPDKKTARDISNKLLEERLIACANILPIESLYWWEGKVTEDDEVVSIVKTRKGLAGKLEKRVMELHPYEVPCIMQLEAKANDSYEQWIVDQTS